MKLSSFLDSRFIEIKGNLRTKKEVIESLLEKIDKKYPFDVDKEKIHKVIEERELLGGTNLPCSISIPHGRIDNLNDLIFAIYIPEEPIHDEGTELKMIILFLIGKKTSNLYLQILSALTGIAMNNDLFNKLINMPDANSFINEIEKTDIKISKNSTVSSIMAKSLFTIKSSDTLKALADLFYKNNISYLPVVDDDGNMIGEVTVLDLIQEGIPNYAMMMENLRFLSNLEPFDKLLEKESSISVREVMKKPVVMLTEDSSIVEAAFEMTQHKLRHIAVVKKNKIVGVVSYMDILKKIIRG